MYNVVCSKKHTFFNSQGLVDDGVEIVFEYITELLLALDPKTDLPELLPKAGLHLYHLCDLALLLSAQPRPVLRPRVHLLEVLVAPVVGPSLQGLAYPGQRLPPLLQGDSLIRGDDLGITRVPRELRESPHVKWNKYSARQRSSMMK